MDLLWVLLWSTAALCLVFPASVFSQPIQVDFNLCQPSTYQTNPNNLSDIITLQCCPIPPTNETAFIYGAPPPSTNYTRVRLAAQCTDQTYADTLNRAYTLMRALPDDDPRSFIRQWELHCAYCGAAFYLINSTGQATPGIDIHFSWLFYPWHRLYLFFHERILQSLLGDPTFSLTYWNWDSPYTVGNASTTDACLTVGNNFPTAFHDSSTAQYDNNRSQNAMGNGRLKFPDLTFAPNLPAVQQPLYNASAQALINNNLGVMKAAMITGGTTTQTFLGRPYRAGDLRGNPSGVGGGGSLEQTAHAGVHFWTGLDPPVNMDMGVLSFSSRDPVFYAHHGNIDRLFSVWRDIGPQVGGHHEYYDDPDFLNAQFEFYDENKALRKVPISDALDTVKLGYTYQATNDAAWINFNFSKCSNLSYEDTLTQARALPAPVPDATGTYHLGAANFIILVTMPATNGTEMFVTVNGIKINRTVGTGFDVYLEILSLDGIDSPQVCSEYVGRYLNMNSAEGRWGPLTNMTMMWTQSIKTVLTAVGVPQPGPSTVVVNLAPIASVPSEGITFTSVTIGPEPS